MDLRFYISRTCSELSELIFLLYSKRVTIYSQRIFLNDFIDNKQVMKSTWQTGAANAWLEFSGKLTLRFFHKNGC